MGKLCRFCNAVRVASLNVNTIDDSRYELRWCTQCGKIQNN